MTREVIFELPPPRVPPKRAPPADSYFLSAPSTSVKTDDEKQRIRSSWKWKEGRKIAFEWEGHARG